MRLRVWLSLMIVAAVCSGDPGGSFQYFPLDDFEDASPWLKGDPNTDLKQHDAAVTTSTEFVKQGKKSLAFLIRVNWTPRPGEKYAKGWPMMRRSFPQSADWSDYDFVFFWLYVKTKLDLRQERVLRIGFPSVGHEDHIDWFTIPGLRPNRWQEVRVPLTMDADWKRITGVTFYVAEQWYRDGDAVDFFIDDMRLAKATRPSIVDVRACARTRPRGRGVELRVRQRGPIAGYGLRCRITSLAGEEQARASFQLRDKVAAWTLATPRLAPGAHYAVVDVVDSQQRAVDTRRVYFRSLEQGKRCYLKLITFYTKPLEKVDVSSLSLLNESAYAGVAIPVLGSYEVRPVPKFHELTARCDAVREALTIDPWPWVALNRIIGAPADRHGHGTSASQRIAYFARIRGVDLDDAAGARSDFLALWRRAARIARRWKSPGIMLDPEAYNDYRVYHVNQLAEMRGEDMDQVIAACRQLGADMAQVLADEFPQAVVWTLFSRLEKRVNIPGRRLPVFTTPSYIVLGLLDYAQQHDLPLKVLCGGETTPGYCNRSVEDLRNKIRQRDALMAPLLERYPRRLFLAGTISPLHDISIATSWIAKGYKDTPFADIESFAPLFRTLFDAYDWVWIYASSAARTLPYDPDHNRIYSNVLRAALDESAGR